MVNCQMSRVRLKGVKLGQKVNPLGFRLGKLYSWKSKWFAQKNDYQKFLLEDIKLRKLLGERLKLAGLVVMLVLSQLLAVV